MLLHVKYNYVSHSVLQTYSKSQHTKTKRPGLLFYQMRALQQRQPSVATYRAQHDNLSFSWGDVETEKSEQWRMALMYLVINSFLLFYGNFPRPVTSVPPLSFQKNDQDAQWSP